MGLTPQVAQLERRFRMGVGAAAPAPAMTRPLTGEELAERLGVSAETIRRWAGEGMPSCGVHPQRRTWPVYDEGACRAWASAHQPQTALRPPAVGESPPSSVAAGVGAAMAEERLRSVRLRNEKLEQALRERGRELLPAGEVRDGIMRLHTALRQRFEALPGRAVPRILAALRVQQSCYAQVRDILDDEIRQVEREIADDPLGINTPAAADDGAGDERVGIARERSSHRAGAPGGAGHHQGDGHHDDRHHDDA